MTEFPKFPGWVPSSVKEYIESDSSKSIGNVLSHPTMVNIVTNDQMRDVWAWYESAISEANRFKTGVPLDEVQLIFSIEESIKLPGKPGNLTPARRREYFKQVRAHVHALKNLLSETIFDKDWRGDSIPLETEQLESDFLAQFLPPGAYEFEYMVCYLFSAGEMSRAPNDFPECALMELLDRVTAWTEQKDFWNGFGNGTSQGILQQTERARINRFVSLIYRDHRAYGISFHTGHLATIANVVFDLAPDELLDEGTVGKQIGRFMKRYGEPPQMLDVPF